MLITPQSTTPKPYQGTKTRSADKPRTSPQRINALIQNTKSKQIAPPAVNQFCYSPQLLNGPEKVPSTDISEVFKSADALAEQMLEEMLALSQEITKFMDTYAKNTFHNMNNLMEINVNLNASRINSQKATYNAQEAEKRKIVNDSADITLITSAFEGFFGALLCIFGGPMAVVGATMLVDAASKSIAAAELKAEANDPTINIDSLESSDNLAFDICQQGLFGLLTCATGNKDVGEISNKIFNALLIVGTFGADTFAVLGEKLATEAAEELGDIELTNLSKSTLEKTTDGLETKVEESTEESAEEIAEKPSEKTANEAEINISNSSSSTKSVISNEMKLTIKKSIKVINTIAQLAGTIGDLIDTISKLNSKDSSSENEDNTHKKMMSFWQMLEFGVSGALIYGALSIPTGDKSTVEDSIANAVLSFEKLFSKDLNEDTFNTINKMILEFGLNITFAGLTCFMINKIVPKELLSADSTSLGKISDKITKIFESKTFKKLGYSFNAIQTFQAMYSAIIAMQLGLISQNQLKVTSVIHYLENLTKISETGFQELTGLVNNVYKDLQNHALPSQVNFIMTLMKEVQNLLENIASSSIQLRN
jgi:hypothetical protein